MSNATENIWLNGQWEDAHFGAKMLAQMQRQDIIQAAYEQGKHLGELAIRFGDTAEAAAFERELKSRVRGWECYAEQMIVRLAFWQGARNLPLDVDEDEVRVHFASEFADEATLAEIANEMKISYNTLAKAVREGRIQARQSGATWLTTQSAVKAALDAGTLRPHIN